MTLQLRFAEFSASGPRPENQDALRLVTPVAALAASKGYLFALADGVSQCADGALAAQSTLQALALDYYSTPETWGVAQSLDRLLLAQNRWLLANGLLTTLSALVLRGRRFTLAHVGDCRAYRWQGGKLKRISEDHVWEQADMQHVLKRALGLDQYVVMDYLEGELCEGERLLLVSDGIWATLGDASIRSILTEQDDLDAAVRTLVSAAHLAGSQDNASALLIQIDSLGEDDLGDALLQLQQWPLPPALKPGQVFEGWSVGNVLAQSRQSILYRAHDAHGLPWLIKTLPSARHDEPGAGQGLLLEEWFLRRVAGRFFPEIHPLPERQHLYYAMREYSGRTLAHLFSLSGPLPLAQWQDLATRLLRATGLLHRRNIIHRDIKPENLLLGDDGELRLLDFGLAFCPGLSAANTDDLPGTPSYIAPEAFSGAEPNPQQDLYAVGVTLYYLLTGQYPYGEIEAFQHRRFGTPIPASRYRPDLPLWLSQSLDKAVQANPAQRYETAEQWQLELEQAEQRPVVARPRPLLEREPLKVWRTLALVSLLINLVGLIWLMSRH
ncbi:bifunctional protein-serine/threonine kinase/phosphatase [Pseudomonas viridiflava]|uniref:bifunctional protein-serine/threonine kinase/phosphatase n=1 Tax=Pseudomonas viridiflava TaxID=33069 RepID=UPI000F035F0C|nr:bifunctional protein-serine/threonine kinase/phosphatase [Pseudomonas viridiflava]MEE3924376.1 bifunctional protein-serine/threonine kinase/phosphatase [Pseudomonas viridiflava]MEE3933736.1 bifunctional protein-serine/threonine kinase/phosphatase [Pseudomonas viridiflava]MEE3943761.1 bifunctional protein-serine/threonine kinase/phosphatase [Pseudomonas viridiflava]MEE3967296.1 bifunctional protein-serine/threonine kinase/phosphatase [Pseudomonas viridiflava]MEE3981424.1 bifunctional protein